MVLGSNKQDKKKRGIRLGDMRISGRESDVKRMLEPIFVTFNNICVPTFFSFTRNRFFKLRNSVTRSKIVKKAEKSD